MAGMTEPHNAVISRLSTDFASISRQLAQVSTDLTELDRILRDRPAAEPTSAQQPFAQQPVAQQAVAQQPQPMTPPAMPYSPHPAGHWPPASPPPGYAPPPGYPQPTGYAPARQQQVPPRPPQMPKPPKEPRPPRSEGWIGKVLAVAGVAVTLIGVVLLLVLAAQAGILRPEIRVAMGGILAGALVAAARWLYVRPGGRVGAISLAATGIATAYMDVIAVTTIYQWAPAAVGLLIAAAIGGGGLTIARRWDSEHLGLLVLVPLLILAPIVTDGITLLLVGFMLALAAVSLPVQIGKDWIWLHCARIAAMILPLLTALAAAQIDDQDDGWLVGACGISATLAIVSALMLLPGTKNRALMGLLTAAGVLPVLCVSAATTRPVAAMMAAALAFTLLAVVLIADRLPGVPGIVRQIWSALSAIAALIAVVVAFDGPVAGPVLLAMGVILGVAGRRDAVARYSALAFSVIGSAFYLDYASPSVLFRGTEVATSTAVSTLISSVLLIACAVTLVRGWVGSHVEEDEADTDETADTDEADAVRLAWAGAAAIVIYAITTFMVTAGVLIGGAGGGFLAGHVAATITWIAMAAGLFGYAARQAKAERSLPIGAGMALVAAAMAKLFVFDLGTLDGIFRVVVFIVVGLILLGMGAGYARLLAQQDQELERDPAEV
jgi:uncharacterized membrane protein